MDFEQFRQSMRQAINATQVVGEAFRVFGMSMADVAKTAQGLNWPNPPMRRYFELPHRRKIARR